MGYRNKRGSKKRTKKDAASSKTLYIPSDSVGAISSNKICKVRTAIWAEQNKSRPEATDKGREVSIGKQKGTNARG